VTPARPRRAAFPVPLTPNLRAILYMIVAAGTFVCNDTMLKLVMSEAPPMQTVAMRGLAAMSLCLPLLLVLGYRRQIILAANPWVVLRACCEVSAISCFIVALRHMPIGDVTAIFQIAPFLLLIGARLIWGEAIGGTRIVLICLGITGALMVANPGSASSSPYAAFGFLTALGSALRDLAGRKVPPDVPGLVVAFSTITMVLIFSAAATLLFETPVMPSPLAMARVLAAGFFLICAHTCVFLAFRRAPAAVVAPFYYSFTVWAVLSGLVVFGDHPSRLALAGMALIIASGLMSIALERRLPRNKAV
jgi:drug/metabolite transporter (DMT)-like permease